MARTKVCHISTVHQTKDVRIYFKQCTSLSKFYDLTLLIREEKKGDHLFKVVPLPGFNNRIARIIIGSWIAFFKAIGQKTKLVHFHDPELLVLAPFFKLFGKKVIFDKHENVKEQILAKEWIGPVFFRSILSGIYALLEKTLIPFCDKVVIVVPEMATDFREGKTTLVRNYPIAKGFESYSASPKYNMPTFVYAGDLSEERGAQLMVELFQEIKAHCQLLLIGRWSSEEFKKKCLDLDKKQRVNSLGFLPIDEVYQILMKSHVGLGLLHPTNNYKQSIPTKVFEYLFAGLSVIITDIAYWKDIFGNKAMYVDPFNQEELKRSISKKIESINDNNDENHRDWAIEQFSWEREFHKLHETYKELLEA